MSGRSAFTRAAALLGPAALAVLIVSARLAAPEEGFRAGISSSLRACAGFEAETARVPLAVANTGSKVWESGGKTPVFISYHVLDAGKRTVRFENARFALPGTVAPGATEALEVTVRAPLEAGRYYLEFDLVAEGLAWFKDGGTKTLVMPFEVGRREWPEDKFTLSLEAGPYTKIDSAVPEFNALMKLIRVTLKHNEVSFEGRTGRVDGFSAGAGYPQIWVRDANTIIPASRYFYPASSIRSWLDELLSYQRPDGSLPDWFDPRGVTDKNTTETDQEASAVQAGRQVYELLGPAWSDRDILGAQSRERLARALEFVWKNRLDVERGLIKGAHTADWGDVEMEDAGRNAIYAGETTRWTSDIYDQSMFFQAANDLARGFEISGPRDKAGLWRERAETVRRNAAKWLWQEDKGFYRVHTHTGPWRHDIDEDDIFAMGGNAQAMISGLSGGPGDDKRRRIIEQALARQKEFGLSTISGSLLPPYPAGFFKHPALDEPYEYQNGGQWDWFGGKLVLAMFESGFAREAREKLLEIARKNIQNGGLYEWDTKDGAGRGSDFYSGSAGSLARALVEGYFGVRMSARDLELSPRLGLDKARVHVHIPASGRFIAYDYRADDKTRKLRLEISCDHESGPTISILDPWASLRSGRVSDGSPDMEVRVNGKKVPFRVERVGRDEYIRLDALTTRFRKGVIEVRILPRT
jgi:Bacterial alpha-L-rhamnosidase 6 hairpin glycosidase domain